MKMVVTRNGVDYEVEANSPDEAQALAIETEKANIPNRSTGEQVTRDLKAGASGVRSGAEGSAGFFGDVPAMLEGATKWGAGLAGQVLPNWTGIDSPEKAAQVGKEAGEAGNVLTKAVSGQYSPIGILLKKAMTAAGIIDPEDVEGNALPTSQDIHENVSSVLPQSVEDVTTYQPTNRQEEISNIFGAFLPGLLTGTGELKAIEGGGNLMKALMQRLGTRVAGPTLLQEGADMVTDRQVEKGTISPETATAIKTILGGAGGIGGGMLEKASAVKRAVKPIDTSAPALRQADAAVTADFDQPEALNRLHDLGPEGKLMDVGPTTRAAAAEAQRAPGPGRDQMRQVLEDRATREKGARDTLREEAFGPDVNRDELKQDINKRVTTERQGYEPALANQAAPVDSQGLVDWIDTKLAKISDKTMRQHLLDVRDSLHVQDKSGTTTVLDPSSEKLLNTRVAIRNKLYDRHGKPRDLGGGEAELLNQMYADVNRLMDTANPDVRGIDKSVQSIKQEKDAFDTGQEVLKKGDKAQSGEEFKKTWDAMQDPVHRQRLTEGVNRYIQGQTDLSVTEQSKLKSIVGSDFNSEKIAAIIGPERAAKFTKGLETLDEFRETKRVVEGQAPADLSKNKSLSEGAPEAAIAGTVFSAGNPIVGGSASAGVVAKNWISRKFGGSDKVNAIRNDLAKLLSSDKPQDILKAAELLEKADRKMIMPQSMVQALLARQADRKQ